MNTWQKLGYMALGAGILAIGIIIGQWGTPDIEAQNKGVFDEIQCKNLIIVDDAGKRAIELGQNGNDVLIYDRADKDCPRQNRERGGIYKVWKKGVRRIWNDSVFGERMAWCR